jgi:hypothetical protein
LGRSSPAKAGPILETLHRRFRDERSYSASPSHSPESSSARIPSRARSGTARGNRPAHVSRRAGNFAFVRRFLAEAGRRLGKNWNVGVKRMPYFAASAFSDISAPSKVGHLARADDVELENVEIRLDVLLDVGGRN